MFTRIDRFLCALTFDLSFYTMARTPSNPFASL